MQCKILPMRLSLSVNDRHIVRASLEAKGWLSAHVNLSHGIDSKEPPNRVSLVAYDESEEPNSVTSTWEGVALAVGDKVEINVLPDGEADAPSTLTRTSESPKNLFSDVEQARLLLSAIKICDTELSGVADRAQATEPPDELVKIRRAIAEIAWALDCQLITPTLRRHPELLAEARAMKLC
jgi:hypothetical protein